MKTIIGENYYAGILDDLIINQYDHDVFEKLEVFLAHLLLFLCKIMEISLFSTQKLQNL